IKMEKFTKLQEILDGMKIDIEKFYEKSQNAAGTRLRKELNNLRKMAAEIRKDIQDIRASRKTGA
ncbi:MAG TPA: histone H1, partial [Ignavibacteria bacterium]|nr:histone H1 [Ignavibacteria bacterium]